MTLTLLVLNNARSKKQSKREPALNKLQQMQLRHQSIAPFSIDRFFHIRVLNHQFR